MGWIIGIGVGLVVVVCCIVYLYRCIKEMMDNDFAGLDMVFGKDEQMEETESIEKGEAQ